MKFLLLLSLYTSSVLACSFPDCTNTVNRCFFYGPKTGYVCDNSAPSLHPQNYSTANVSILLDEKFGPIKKEQDESSYAVAKKSKEQYLAAVLSEVNTPPEEKEKLMTWAQAIWALYSDKIDPKFEEALTTKDTLGYQFVKALEAFNIGHYEISYESFLKLKDSDKKFLAEYSYYLAMRSALLNAQFNWSGYSNEPGIDANWVEAANTVRLNYLKNYPNGVFSNSARALERKIIRLKSDMNSFFPVLNRFVDEELQKKTSETRQVLQDLFDEYDFHAGQVKSNRALADSFHPLYWPIYANEVTRINDYEATPAAVVEDAFKRLKAKEANFAKYPLEWAESMGAFYFYQKNYQSLIDLLNKTKEKSFSTETMKAQALIELKKYKEAQVILAEIKNYELLFLSYYHGAQLREAFVKKSLLPPDVKWVQPAIQAMSSKEILDLILDHEFNSFYADAFADLFINKATLENEWGLIAKLQSKKYAKLIEEAKKLETNPKLPAPRLTILKHVGTSTYDYSEYFPECEANSTELSNPKHVNIPLVYYTQILDSLNPKESYSFEAELLFNAIRCYKTTNNISCTLGAYLEDPAFSQIASLDKRKLWFKRLHSKYGKTKFAKMTQYYY